MHGVYRDPYLLTPGPLTTSLETKKAMLHDWGSRDQEFIAFNRQVRECLVEIAGGAGRYTTVPIQGSGTFAVEAMIGTFLPRDGQLLLLVNGASGRRMAKICDYLGRAYATSQQPEAQPTHPSRGQSHTGPVSALP